MDIKIKECLSNGHHSYILPFLWLHGEPKERVREEMLAIKNSGIREFCAESRPYKKFCRDEWWDDFGYILKTARELDMGVWLLDDRAFPTGYANGYLEKEENAHLRKKLIREIQIEALGPTKGASFFVGGRVFEGESVVSITAMPYENGETGERLDFLRAVDLTDNLNGSMLYWDVPKGNWRVCVTVLTRIFEHRDDRFFYYIDMLSKMSCHAMIDAIYEPHYQHFKEYFGNTFKGFFSDEPGFLNVLDTYENKLGIMGSSYPFGEELIEEMVKNTGLDKKQLYLLLPALWEDMGTASSIMRIHYMDAATKLYRENFSYQLGNWCRDHGVMYIGHVIEDMGAHTRLGYGSGHYFRALDGQDMGGIDIVLMQDIPGIPNNIHRAPLADGGAADPAFFRYTLPKLASSHAHIQPLKKDRAMCEIFGAFGWAEGLPFMKGLADIMLASGINYFVPHAFSPKEEDEDCPPHFYNGGKNVEYPLFGKLMGYMGRCAHALSGGKHRADVAVLYNAECEWSGGNSKQFYNICRTLTQGNIDFDIVPFDALDNGAEMKNGRLYINGEDYGALIASKSEKLPYLCVKTLKALASSGLPVIFVNGAVRKIAEDNRPVITGARGIESVSLRSLVSTLRGRGLCQLECVGRGAQGLRFYHVEREGKDIYLFSNEDIFNTVNLKIKLKQAGECLIYEPWDNKCYRGAATEGVLDLTLEKGNMLFVIFGDEIPENTPKMKKETAKKRINASFDISLLYEGEEIAQKIASTEKLFDITAPDKYPEFSGKVIYESVFEGDLDYNAIDLGQVGEVAEVWLNGVYLGARINAPYKFSMKDALRTGENRLKVVVTANLGHRRRDWLSSYMQIPPTGLVGNIYFSKYE